MEHEPLPRLAVDHLDLLLIVRSAEGDGHERLCLTTRKDGRAVGARQNASFDGDVADLVELAAIETAPAFERLVLHDLLLAAP